jgi:hypothetical protein
VLPLKTKDLGEAQVILGLEMSRDRARRHLTVHQSAYIQSILRRFGLHESRGVSTPADAASQFTAASESEPRADTTEFMRLTGSLMYAMVGTRPDIAWALGKLCQQNAKPAARHFLAAKRVLRNLMETTNYGLTYGTATSVLPVGYCDSDYASDPETRRSISGNIFTVAGSAVSWASR